MTGSMSSVEQTYLNPCFAVRTMSMKSVASKRSSHIPSLHSHVLIRNQFDDWNTFPAKAACRRNIKSAKVKATMMGALKMVNMGVEPRTLALLAPRSKPTELIDRCLRWKVSCANSIYSLVMLQEKLSTIEDTA